MQTIIHVNITIVQREAFERLNTTSVRREMAWAIHEVLSSKHDLSKVKDDESEPFVKQHLNIPESLHVALKSAAGSLGTSVSGIVRRCLSIHLVKQLD